MIGGLLRWLWDWSTDSTPAEPRLISLSVSIQADQGIEVSPAQITSIPTSPSALSFEVS